MRTDDVLMSTDDVLMSTDDVQARADLARARLCSDTLTMRLVNKSYVIRGQVMCMTCRCSVCHATFMSSDVLQKSAVSTSSALSPQQQLSPLPERSSRPFGLTANPPKNRFLSWTSTFLRKTRQLPPPAHRGCLPHCPRPRFYSASQLAPTGINSVAHAQQCRHGVFFTVSTSRLRHRRSM